jgi:UDP-4-amino-4,6-dideoxy-N-acetyl-beta-L-altrosamine transaminase
MPGPENPIPYGRQTINEADIEAVRAVLRSDWLTQGPAIERFERGVTDYCGARHAVAACNATAALHLACRALDLGPGDLLWTTPNTFVASANCGLYTGAEVDFVDIDPLSYNMSADKLRQKLEKASTQGRLPKVVVPVDFSGQSAEMAEIAQLGQQYGFRIIEDASHAIGGNYKNKQIGACTHSDITVFSFHPVKIITTGEGGMALTNDAGLQRKLALLRSHGINRNSRQISSKVDEGGWYYEQVDLGFNYRMTDLQAALGLSQLGRINEFVARRRYLAARYTEALRPLAVKTPWQSDEGESAWHLYVIQIDSARTKRTRREVFGYLRRAGVLVNVHYIPVHLQPYYRRMGFGPGDFPEAEAYYDGAITLPLYFGLTEEKQEYVIRMLSEALA